MNSSLKTLMDKSSIGGDIFNDQVSFPELPFPGRDKKPTIRMMPKPKRYKIMIGRATGLIKTNDLGSSLSMSKSYTVNLLPLANESTPTSSVQIQRSATRIHRNRKM